MARVLRPNATEGVVIENVTSDLRVRGYSGTDIRVEGDDPEIHRENDSSPIHIRSNSDCQIKMPDSAPLTIQHINGDAKITNLDSRSDIEHINGDLIARHIGDTVIGNVDGDCIAKYISGELQVKNINGDMIAQNIAGDMVIENVHGDLEVREVSGSCTCSNVGGDLEVVIDFQDGNNYQFACQNTIAFAITSQTNVMFIVPKDVNISVDGSLNDVDLEIEDDENGQQIIIGEGGAEVHVLRAQNVDLTYRSGFHAEIDISLDLEDQMHDIGRQVNESLSGLGDMIGMHTQNALDSAASAISQSTGFIKKFNVKDMEHRVKRAEERANRHADRMQRHSERQAKRAERRAEKILRFKKRQRDQEIQKDPVSNEERLMILRMVEEGKLTIEEAEKLLSALEGR